jgi:hypothetical protein
MCSQNAANAILGIQILKTFLGSIPHTLLEIRQVLHIFYTDWSIKRTIWLFIIEVYPVPAVRYSKQRIYFITGSSDFPNIANCV